ncbi:hypothetical protein ACQ4PT_031565 [Festuca glaucescens]
MLTRAGARFLGSPFPPRSRPGWPASYRRPCQALAWRTVELGVLMKMLIWFAGGGEGGWASCGTRLANLIGYCCDGDEPLLVAEFMPNDTLAKHPVHWENQTIEWAMHLRVAYYIAEALGYCSNEERALYHDLQLCRETLDRIE